MINTYEVTSSKIKGDFSLQFKEGNLIGVKMELEACLNQARHSLLFNKIPFLEADLPKLKALGLMIRPQQPTNVKIALFCQLYEHYVKIKYKVSPADSGKMKLLKVDREMLIHYFSSANFLFAGKWSISNLTKYYNELRAEIANAGKSKYPDYWTEAFEAKLTDKERNEYWAHLRSLGFEVKKDTRTGRTMDWIKKL